MDKTVNVTFSRKAGTLGKPILRIQGKEIVLDDAGKGSASCPAGQYYLDYFVDGVPTSKFTIAITAPPEAKWTSPKKVIPPHGWVFGYKRFRINQS